MKLTARGGTDGASIVLFWPANLPEGADAMLQEDPVSLAEQLQAEGKLLWFPCTGVGDYTLAIFVDTPIPEDLARHCREVQRYPALTLPGKGYFGGQEYMFKHDSGLSDKYLGMIERVMIPEGTYAAVVYETDLPPGHSHNDWTTVLMIALVCGTLVGMGTRSWLLCLGFASAAVLLILATVLRSRRELCRSGNRAQENGEQESPSYVLQLMPLGSQE